MSSVGDGERANGRTLRGARRRFRMHGDSCAENCYEDHHTRAHAHLARTVSVHAHFSSPATDA
jgi:hypothetical protein